MDSAILLSNAGLRQFLGLDALSRRTGALLLFGFVALQTGAMFRSTPPRPRGATDVVIA